MKRKLAYLMVILPLAILLLGSSELALNRVKPLVEYFQNRFGDTYRLCNLTAYKQRVPLPEHGKEASRHPKVHVALIGDSFSWKISRTSYQCGHFTHSTWRRPIPPILQEANVNILLLETTERFCRERFGDISHFVEDRRIRDDTTLLLKLERVFRFKSEDNLQSILFFDPISLFLRETKAKINQKWFGRIDENVAISSNGKHLYINETIDTNLITSSFKYLSDVEVRTMAGNLNALRELALSKGYDAVYLSIPPNKVSVADKHYQGLSYNHLIDRIEKDTSLKMPVIPVLDWIRQDQYYVGDTHWNREGIREWTQLVNAMIEKEAARKAGVGSGL